MLGGRGETTWWLSRERILQAEGSALARLRGSGTPCAYRTVCEFGAGLDGRRGVGSCRTVQAGRGQIEQDLRIHREMEPRKILHESGR